MSFERDEKVNRNLKIILALAVLLVFTRVVFKIGISGHAEIFFWPIAIFSLVCSVRWAVGKLKDRRIIRNGIKELERMMSKHNGQ